MVSNFIIRNDCNVYQRKSAAVKLACQRWIGKLIQPPGGLRIGAAFTRIEKHRYHQWQLFVACLKMPLHGGYCVAYQPESHVFVRR